MIPSGKRTLALPHLNQTPTTRACLSLRESCVGDSISGKDVIQRGFGSTGGRTHDPTLFEQPSRERGARAPRRRAGPLGGGEVPDQRVLGAEEGSALPSDRQRRAGSDRRPSPMASGSASGTPSDTSDSDRRAGSRKSTKRTGSSVYLTLSVPLSTWVNPCPVMPDTSHQSLSRNAGSPLQRSSQTQVRARSPATPISQVHGPGSAPSVTLCHPISPGSATTSGRFQHNSRNSP